MEAMKKLKNWIELEHDQAKRNVADSRPELDGFYHRYNQGRESALRSVMDKIDVLLLSEASAILEKRPDLSKMGVQMVGELGPSDRGHGWEAADVQSSTTTDKGNGTDGL